MEEHLDEYQFNYKHKMSDFSSINLKDMNNFSIQKQIGRDKVGYLRELNKFFKRRKKNESVSINETILPVARIHSIDETSKQTSHIQKQIKNIQKLAENMTYERFMKMNVQYS